MLIPNYAELLKVKLLRLNIKIVICSDANLDLSQRYTQLKVDAPVEKFGEIHINNLAEFIAKSYKSITFSSLPLPKNIVDAELQISENVIVRVITDYVMGSGDNDPYADKLIRRVDILIKESK